MNTGKAVRGRESGCYHDTTLRGGVDGGLGRLVGRFILKWIDCF